MSYAAQDSLTPDQRARAQSYQIEYDDWRGVRRKTPIEKRYQVARSLWVRFHTWRYKNP